MLALRGSMGTDTSIFAKRYYRVVLKSIDADRETPATFAMKLAMRLRTPLPRVRQVVEALPAVVKVGLTISQANTLRAILEEMGAEAEIQEYFLTPGQEREASVGMQLHRSAVDHKERQCPACGWEEDEDAEYCSLCLQRFEPKRSEKNVSPPPENPLGDLDRSASSRPDWKRWALVAAGVVIVILLVALVKK